MDGKPCITLYLPLQSVKLDGLIPQPISPQSASTSQADRQILSLMAARLMAFDAWRARPEVD